MVDIPKQLIDCSFVLLDGDDGKKPIEKSWQKRIRKQDDSTLINHLKNKKNYGVRCGSASPIIINEEVYSLIGVDFDNAELQEKLLKKLPETFSVKTGGKGLLHLYFASNNDKSFKIFDEKMVTLADIQGEGKQLVGPGSKNYKTTRTYDIVKDIPISFVDYAELKAIFMSYDKSPKRVVKPKKQYIPKGVSNDISQEILNCISMDEVLQEVNVDISRNPTNCFTHDSSGGKCLGYDLETAHCFHCEKSWNKYTIIREAKNLTDKQTFEWFAERCGKLDELTNSRKEYISKDIITTEGAIFSRRGQIEEFWKRQPFFYDNAKMFWLWDKEQYKWTLSDEVDFCNLIYDTLGIETINSKSKGELVEGFKQVGRRHKPKDIEKTWIQYKDKIYDGKSSKELFKASPEYFAKNPIPWKVGKTEDTPNIDKLFLEWVGEDYKRTLQEITTYTTTPDKFMQRLIALVGGGANGKGTYIKLLNRFIGKDNIVSSEMKSLSEDKFEAAVLYGKLLCVMGEVSSDDLRNTNMLKKIGGEDDLSFQFKGKTPFTKPNTSTCMCLTNSLPITPDKSIGFYRKFLIIDFPNQFTQIKENPINKIPEEEFENMAKKCLRILKEMYETSKFTNEGTFDERIKRYEDRSNPIMRFIEDKCTEEVGEVISLRNFTNIANTHFKENHLRIMTARQVGKILREEGFDVGNRKVDDISTKVILNLKLNMEIKTTRTTRTTHISNQNIHKKRIENTMVLGSFGSLNNEENEFKELFKDG